MNTTMADGVSERLDAQIADALFGQPGMSKMDVANRLLQLRGDGGALLGSAAYPAAWMWPHPEDGSVRFTCDGDVATEAASMGRAVSALYRVPVQEDAQPSPTGQGDAPWPEVDMILADAYSAGAEGLQFEGIARRAAVRAAVAALAARQPVGATGKDSLTVGGGEAWVQEPAGWQTMASCPRDGTAILLRWGEDHVSPGWWCADASPIQNEDGTWSSDNGGFPWAFFDLNDGVAFVNHAVDTEHGPTHWAPYVYPPAHAVDLGEFRDLIGFATYHAINLPETDPRRDFLRQANEFLALIDSNASAGEPNTERNQLMAGVAGSVTRPWEFRDALLWAEDAADCSSHPDHKAFRFAFTELLGIITSEDALT